MIEAVLFDLDMTILDRDASLQACLADQHWRQQSWLGHIPCEAYIKRFTQLDNNGYSKKEDCYAQIINELDIHGISPTELTVDYREHFQHHCVPCSGLFETLTALQMMGTSLGMITNGRYPFQLLNVQALGIEHFFETILVSDKEGIRKPEAAIFERALAKMNVAAETAVFVGDNPEADVRGAQNIGMVGIWKQTNYWGNCSYADAIISQLIEVPEILQTWQKP